jgi:chromosome segregation ATPase
MATPISRSQEPPRLPLDPSAAEGMETDSLAGLEERILRTVELVQTLKAQRDKAYAERDAAFAERDTARKATDNNGAEVQKLRDELAGLRSERKHVRTRIEKLLGQMDLLSGE